MNFSAIRSFLELLEKRLPPPMCCHHSIHFAQYGSDATGWEPRLALSLHLAQADGSSTYSTLFLEAQDGKKPASVLVSEIVRLVETQKAERK